MSKCDARTHTQHRVLSKHENRHFKEMTETLNAIYKDQRAETTLGDELNSKLFYFFTSNFTF